MVSTAAWIHSTQYERYGYQRLAVLVTGQAATLRPPFYNKFHYQQTNASSSVAPLAVNRRAFI